MSFRVDISRNKNHIVVEEVTGGEKVFLTRLDFDTYFSQFPHWAAIQLDILTAAQILGWSP